MGVDVEHRRLVSRPEPLPEGGLASLAPPLLSAFFLDVDGTLLEIRPLPGDVVADAPLRALLARLADAAASAVALVSGRRIDDLDRIFSPMALPAAGLHGAEIRFGDGVRTHADDGAMAAARAPLRGFVELHSGLMLEDKGATLALHYRQRPDLAGAALDAAQGVAEAFGLAVQRGKMVAELKQASHSKATAIEALLARPPFAGRRPVFVGDDLTDEIGFACVNARDGVSVRIGTAEASTARFQLGDPAALRAELAALLRQG